MKRAMDSMEERGRRKLPAASAGLGRRRVTQRSSDGGDEPGPSPREKELLALQRRVEGNRGARETAQLEARLQQIEDVGGGSAGSVVIQPMWPFDQIGDWISERLGDLLFPEIEDDEGNLLFLGSHEIGNLERWGEHIISNRSGRDRPDFTDQGVFDDEMAVFFRSVIAGRQTLTQVRPAQRGRNENLAYVPVYWTFDGEVHGVGFNVHVDQHGDLTPGSAWMVGVNGMAVQPQDLDVDFDAVIRSIRESDLGERFDGQVGRAQGYQENKARQSDLKWKNLGRWRRGSGGASSSSKQDD